jgi:hypothetical protein
MSHLKIIKKHWKVNERVLHLLKHFNQSQYFTSFPIRSRMMGFQ